MTGGDHLSKLIRGGWVFSSRVQAAIEAAHTPNVHAVAQRLTGSGGILVLQQFLHYARTCVQPGLNCFEEQLTTSLKDSLSAFKSARYFLLKKSVLFSQMQKQSILFQLILALLAVGRPFGTSQPNTH